MERRDPDLAADERTTLVQFLDYQRDTLLWKCEGLTDEELRRTTAASDLTLAGLLKHLALVEDHWFRVILLGDDKARWWRDVDFKADPDWDFTSALGDSGAHLIALYSDACETSRKAVESVESLDGLSALKYRRTGKALSLRWILVHMIEETARHNGHADLLREAIDGSTGE